MNTRAKEVLTGLTRKFLPASEDLIERFVSALGYAPPEDYLEFLRISNGAEGWPGPNEYLILDSVEEVARANIEDKFWGTEYAPGLLLFGSDGGGTAYAFDARIPSMPVVDTPFIGGGLDYLTLRGDTFSEFIESLADA